MEQERAGIVEQERDAAALSVRAGWGKDESKGKGNAGQRDGSQSTDGAIRPQKVLHFYVSRSHFPLVPHS